MASSISDTAMGSSKTANAVMVQYNYRERGQRVLMLKPKIENRDGATVVRSRCGLVAQCRYVEELGGIDLTGIDCIIVDECHFMNAAQVRQLVDIVDEREIPVICYGLRTDFRGELFEGSRELLRWADTIEEIKTVCWWQGNVRAQTGTSSAKAFGNAYVSVHWKDGNQFEFGRRILQKKMRRET